MPVRLPAIDMALFSLPPNFSAQFHLLIDEPSERLEIRNDPFVEDVTTAQTCGE